MLDWEQVKRTLEMRKAFYAQEYGVSRMAIFGSYSRGEQSESSDVDIMVEFDRPIGLRFVDLAEDLESWLSTRMDLVSRKAMKPGLLRMIEPDFVYV